MQDETEIERAIEVVQRDDDDGIAIVERAPKSYATVIPKDLFTSPPSWAQALIERGATYAELAQEIGNVATRSSGSHRVAQLLHVVEQMIVTDEGRKAIDLVLTPGFVAELFAASMRPLILIPAMIVYENANASGHSAWLNPHEDEVVDPVGALQQSQLDRAISAVWQSNTRPFVELFLFDGPDLQGRLIRFARVTTPVYPLPIVLTAPNGFNDQARSLLASSRSLPGRRFSARQHLLSLLTTSPAQHAQAPFGTITLTQPPQFSWDAYKWWQSNPSYHSKTAALRMRVDFEVDDVAYGGIVGFQTWDVMFRPHRNRPDRRGRDDRAFTLIRGARRSRSAIVSALPA